MNKKTWMKIHSYLSLFFLPLAIIYVITGALYIFGLNHNTGAHTQEYKIHQLEKGKELDAILNTLNANALKIPKDTTIKKSRNSVYIGDISYQASISKNKNNEDVLRVVSRGTYGILVLMHKSHGKKYEISNFKFSIFDFLAIGFGISMLMFYVSGLIVTSFCKKNRGTAFSFLGAGFVISILAIYLSI